MARPRHKRRTLPLPAQPSTNAVDLYLLAGFPKPLLARVEEYLQTLVGGHSNFGAFQK